jgi:hypothetical protein
MRKLNIEKVDKLLIVFSILFFAYSLYFISSYWFVLEENTVIYHSSTKYDTLNLPVQKNENYKMIAFTYRKTYYPEESFSSLRIDIYVDSIYKSTFSVINPLDQTEPTPTSSSISTSGFYDIRIVSGSTLTLRVDDLIADSWILYVYKDLAWIYFIGNVNFPVFGIIFLVIGLIMFNAGWISLKKRKKSKKTH